MKYKVYVDDNFHYGDESERYLLGEFDTAEEALDAARRIVDEFLVQGYQPGMSARKLFEGYRDFGEDPFVESDDPGCRFSAWDYARQRSRELAGETENP